MEESLSRSLNAASGFGVTRPSKRGQAGSSTLPAAPFSKPNVEKRKGPSKVSTPFPLAGDLPSEPDTEDDRLDAEVERQERGRAARKGKGKARDEAVLMESGPQEDTRWIKRRKEEAGPSRPRLKKERSPFPLPARTGSSSSTCDRPRVSSKVTPVDTIPRKRPVRRTPSNISTTSPTSEAVLTVPSHQNPKTIRKSAALRESIAVTDSPDPLDSLGHSTTVKKKQPPLPRPFPLPDVGSFESTPRPLKFSTAQSSLNRYVSQQLSVLGSSSLGSSPVCKKGKGKRKKTDGKVDEKKPARRESSDFLRGDGASTPSTRTGGVDETAAAPKKRGVPCILSPGPECDEMPPLKAKREEEGHAFFDALGRIDVGEDDGIWGSSTATETWPSSSPLALSSQLAPVEEFLAADATDVDEDEEDDDGTHEQTDADKQGARLDKEYLESYVDPSDLCPYCDMPMPLLPSRYLLFLRTRLISIFVPDGAELDWKHYTEFCSLHEAETSVIPLGERDGFPTRIDFLSLPKRLTSGWIGSRLGAIAKNPKVSPLFGHTVSEIKRIGKTRWGQMAHQASEKVVNLTMPGYYGHLGRACLLRHFQSLLNWGFLSALAARSDRSSASLIHPLSSNDFISHVLIPEAAILLIMEDRGWRGGSSSGYREEVERTESAAIRMRSVEYGRWKFRAEGEEAEEILNHLEKRDPATKHLIEQSRRCSLSPDTEDGNPAPQPATISDSGSLGSVVMVSPVKVDRRPRLAITPDSETTAISPSRSPSSVHTSKPVDTGGGPRGGDSLPTPPQSASSRHVPLPPASHETRGKREFALQPSSSLIYDGDGWDDAELIAVAIKTERAAMEKKTETTRVTRINRQARVA